MLHSMIEKINFFKIVEFLQSSPVKGVTQKKVLERILTTEFEDSIIGSEDISLEISNDPDDDNFRIIEKEREYFKSDLIQHKPYEWSKERLNPRTTTYRGALPLIDFEYFSFIYPLPFCYTKARREPLYLPTITTYHNNNQIFPKKLMQLYFFQTSCIFHRNI